MELYFFLRRNALVLMMTLVLIISAGFLLSPFLFDKDSESPNTGLENKEDIQIPIEQREPIASRPITGALNQNTVAENSGVPQSTLNKAQTAAMPVTNASAPVQPAEVNINPNNVVSSAMTLTESTTATPPPAAPPVDTAQAASQPRSREEAEALLASINEEAGVNVDLNDQTASKPVVAATHNQASPQPVSAQSTTTEAAPDPSTLPKSVVIIDPGEKEKKAAISHPPKTHPAASSNALNQDLNRASRQIKGRYTLQLIGLRSRDEAARFIQQHQLKASQIVPVRAHEQVWYAVVSGDFESAASAKKALSHLPASLKHLQPWIRPLESLQAAMLKSKQPLKQVAASHQDNSSAVVKQTGLF